MGLFEDSKELQFRTSKLQQKSVASPKKQRERMFHGEKGEKVGRGGFEGKSHWRKARVQADDGFSLTSGVPGVAFPCRREKRATFSVGASNA